MTKFNNNDLMLWMIVCCGVSIFGCSTDNDSTVQSIQGPRNNITVQLSDNQNLEFVWLPELGLWAGKHEVTLGQFMLMSRRAARRPSEYEGSYTQEGLNLMNAPAVMISWREANRACNMLNRRYAQWLPEGYMFRLPTEKEWETMARCGDDRQYPWGDEWPPTKMADGVYPNLQGSEIRRIMGRIPPSIHTIEGYSDGWPSVAPVDKSGANEWGIYGLAGNVSEWCHGWYDKSNNLRLLKGSSASSSRPHQAKISARGSVDGHGFINAIFLWGTKKNQGHVFSGFRVVIAKPVPSDES